MVDVQNVFFPSERRTSHFEAVYHLLIDVMAEVDSKTWATGVKSRGSSI